jgi:hypothetical protein
MREVNNMGRKLSKELIDQIESGDAIALIWQIEDVINEGKEIGITVTPEQAREVLEEVESNHDCTMGVSWESIRTAMDTIL